MDNLIAESFQDFLAGHCTPDVVRAIEREPHGKEAQALWNALSDSGFADALAPEGCGGAGLELRDVAPLAFTCGRHSMPLPFMTTMCVRAALAEAGLPQPEGAATVAPSLIEAQGSFSAPGVPYGLTANQVLVHCRSGWELWPVTEAAISRGSSGTSLTAHIVWSRRPSLVQALVNAPPAAHVWRATAVALLAAQMAGAMTRALEMTIHYANERVQFGKPIGKLQAVQQQISVMAQHTTAARAAALIGLNSSTWHAGAAAAAVAKGRTSEAAGIIASIAHAVHGAIGVTEEFDLQLLTRRLHEWRVQYGSEAHWNRALGRIVLHENGTPIDWARRIAADERPPSASPS